MTNNQNQSKNPNSRLASIQDQLALADRRAKSEKLFGTVALELTYQNGVLENWTETFKTKHRE